jgi:protein-L-isoaspartate(D-aspartate) O-methyltransferase
MLAEELWQKLELEGAIRNEKVGRALRKVHRENFVQPSYKKYAYTDMPLPIGHGQTISAPHMVALMTSLLRVEPGQKILEVGAGSGYQAAVILQLLEGKGKVYSLERVQALVDFAEENLTRQEYKNYRVLKRDGSKGLQEYKPFDRIIVTASAKRVPEPLLEQLKVGGLMLIPVGNELLSIRREKKEFKQKVEEYVSFVPLIEE